MGTTSAVYLSAPCLGLCRPEGQVGTHVQGSALNLLFFYLVFCIGWWRLESSSWLLPLVACIQGGRTQYLKYSWGAWAEHSMHVSTINGNAEER